MWLYGLICITFMAFAKCSEAEVAIEAAFQGRCGHGSPCEQLCYELHDGMYECDCAEGFELHKNGYSCQEINSTFPQNSEQDMNLEEDILYQKGASFSAKLDDSNIVNIENNLQYSKNRFNSSNSKANSNSNNIFNEEDEGEDITDDRMSDKDIVNDWINKRKLYNNNNNDNNNNNNNNNVESRENNNNNKNDEDVEDSEDDEDEDDNIVLYNENIYNHNFNDFRIKTTTTHEPKYSKNKKFITLSPKKYLANQSTQKIITTKVITPITTTIKTTTTRQTTTTPQTTTSYSNYYLSDTRDEFYSKEEDMSVYDDVNNNKLNLNNIHNNYYNSPSVMKFNSDANDNTNNNNNNNNKDDSENYNNGDDDSDVDDNQNSQEFISTSSSQFTVTTSSPNTPKLINSKQNKNDNQNGHDDSDEGRVIIISSETNNIKQNNLIETTSDSVSLKGINSTADTTASKLSGSCQLDCGLDGVCDSGKDDNNFQRCLCPFGKAGIKCEQDIKINVPRFTKKSWIAFPALRGAYKHVQLHIEFRPESFDGIILLTGERDDLTGDFMAVLIHQGFIEFWFDCGSGTGKVRSEETVILNQWNSITIYRHRWDAWLILNQGNRVQGRSQGLFSRITFREPVFLGGTGNITGLVKKLPILDGMIGCIRKFIANDHEYNFNIQPYGDVSQGFDVQECSTDRCSHFPCHHGGKCLPSDQGAICLCPLGFGGDLCEMRLDLQVPSFNGSSYLRFAPLGDSSLIWLELKIILKPLREDGLLLYSGHHEFGDYISLCLSMGFIEFTFDLGSGPATVRSEFPLTMGQWHTIKISRTARLAVVKIDQLPEVMTISPNGFWHLSLPHSLFLGGVHNMQILPLNLREKGSFVGCIQRIDINEHPLSIISEALGGSNVDNCPHACVARPCGPLARCIPNLESYECQCNPSNAQCNSAEEVFITTTTVKPTTTKKPTTTTTTTIAPPTTTQSSNEYDNYNNDDDDDELMYNFNMKHAYEDESSESYKSSENDEVMNIKETTKNTENGTPYPITENIKNIFKSPDDDKENTYNTNYDNNNNDNNNDDNEYFYEYDEENNENIDKNNENNEERIIVNPNSKHHFSSFSNENKNHDDNEMIQLKSSTTQNLFKYTNKPDFETQQTEKMKEIENAKQKLDVTRVNGRYMSVDNEQLLKYDELQEKYKNKNLNNKNRSDNGGYTISKSKNNNNNNKSNLTPPGSPQINYYTEKEFLSKMHNILKNDRKFMKNYKKDHGACFTGTDSYLHFSDAETMRRIISYQIDLNLRFKTHSSNGLILWTGRHTAQEDDDFLSLGIENGYLHLRYNLGSGEVNIKYNSTKVSDGLWHRIRANRNLQEGSLEVDGGRSMIQRSPGKLRQLNTDTGLYVGGMTNAYFYTRRRYDFGIVGCISEVILAGELRLNMDASTIGTAHNVEPGVP